MADLNALASKYRSGEVTLEQLKSQYKLSTSDIEKIKQINAKIDKELGVKNEHQPLPGSTEITLDDGTKVLAAKIRTVNQPKGGFVNVYMAQDGKQYYQYTDANGNQQKVTKDWDYVSATGNNIVVAWNKMQDGHPWDALMTLMEGAEDPRELTTGDAPAVGFAKGGGIIKSMKDFGKWLKELKNIKSFEQFKSFAMSFIQKMKPKKVANNATKQQVKQMKSFEQIQKEYYMKGVKNLKDNYNIEVVATRRRILHGLREEEATVDIIYQGKKYNISVESYNGYGVETEGNVLKTFFERLKKGKDLEEILRYGVLTR